MISAILYTVKPSFAVQKCGLLISHNVGSDRSIARAALVGSPSDLRVGARCQ